MLYLIQRIFVSLRHKNFRLFFTGQAISLIGSWVQQTALSWLIYDLTGSKFLLGTVAAISSLPMLFLSAFAGVIADKYPKRRTLLLTQSFAMINAAVLAALVFTHIVHVWHIMVIATILGIIMSIDMPVRQAFYIDIVGKDDLMNAVALNSTIVNLARILGPALAGIIMVKFGLFWCFALNSLSFLAVLFALFKLELPKIDIKRRKESVIRYTISGFNYVKKNKLIFNLIILMIITGVFGSSCSILLPAVAKDMFYAGEKGYAMLVSANGVGALLGALLIAYMGNAPRKFSYTNLGIYLSSFALIALALCKDYAFAMLLLILLGIGTMMFFSATTTAIQSTAEDSYRGRVMGIWALAFGGVIPIGSIYIGTLAQHIGIPATLIINGAICILFTAAVSALNKPTEELQVQEEIIEI